MKKRLKKLLCVFLALVLAASCCAVAAFAEDEITMEAVAEANTYAALMARHSSFRCRMVYPNGEEEISFATPDYVYVESLRQLYDDLGVWDLTDGEDGLKLLYLWFAAPDNGQSYLQGRREFFGTSLNVESTATESILAVDDNGDGTLRITTEATPEFIAHRLEEDPDIPISALRYVYTVDAKTLDLLSMIDRATVDGETKCLSTITVEYDLEEPPEIAVFREKTAAFRAGTPAAPRTITIHYDYGTPDAVKCSVTADRSFFVGPILADGYDLLYTDPERTQLYAGGDGISDVTIYAYAYGNRYLHDPRLNERTMADVVADENAVYGFRPSPEGSLKQYADADWSDPELVANGRAERIAYHQSLQEMYALLDSLRAAGEDIETIARAVSTRRNELRLAACTSEEELARTKARNLEKYGHEEGPLPDELYAQYGDWETVISKAFSANSGMDACLGLYDDHYELYLASGQISPEAETRATRQYAVAAIVDALDPAYIGDGASLDAFADANDIAARYLPEWEFAVERGLVRGYPDGLLRPERGIPRLEALALLSRCLPELDTVGAPLVFNDVPDWAKADIDRLSAAGLVLGRGDGTLGAADVLTVEELSLLLARAME